MNKIIAVLSTIILFFLSFWLGESGKGLIQVYPFIIGLVGTLTIPYLISNRWKHRTAYAVLFILFYTAAFYMGNLSFDRTYRTCLKEAEQIRTALSIYKTENGKYPDNLDNLNMPLPGSRCLRGTILEYESTASNYTISFKDWLIEHSATDKEPFMAHK